VADALELLAQAGRSGAGDTAKTEEQE
jgi:hypothetical protein